MRLIDADAIVKRLKELYCKNCNNYNGVKCRACAMDDALSAIDDAPTIEAGPVVRCKDCKWSKPATNGKGQDGYGCTKDDNPAYEAFWWLTPDWFCADGERKEP